MKIKLNTEEKNYWRKLFLSMTLRKNLNVNDNKLNLMYFLEPIVIHLRERL